MSRCTRPLLPEPLQASLTRLGEIMRQGRAPLSEELAPLIDQFSALSPGVVVRADREIADLAQLYHRPEPRGGILLAWSRKPSDLELILQAPGLKHLFVFHRDGRLREAALNRFNDGMHSPFLFAAIAWRLNDWALPVRKAAAACAERVFPKTDPAIIASAAMFLLDRRQHWRRWDDEGTVLESTLSRPDVTQHLADIIRNARSGPLATLLRRALRWEEMDRHLPTLSAEAYLPSVRAAAFQPLIEGKAIWPIGYKREWVDKSLGKDHRIAVFAERPVVRPQSPEKLIARAAGDDAATVRRIAAIGLLRHQSAHANLEEVIQRLANDRSRTVRERIAFILKERSRQQAPGA